jgi:hypothetical protein
MDVSIHHEPRNTFEESVVTSIRDEINWIAQEIQSTAVQARETAGDLAKRLEELFRNESNYDTSIADMDERYVWRDDSYMWTTETGKEGSTVVGATGVVPVDDSIKRELRLYEHLIPALREEYVRNRYTDEVIYCDKRSMVVGQTTTNFEGLFPSGFDAWEVCRSGVTYYDYYGWVDPDLNPERLPRWAPSAFVDLLGAFIQSVHAPVFRGETDTETSGFMGLHYNLEWVNAGTVYKSENRILILSSRSTLIGSSPDAMDVLGLQRFERQDPSFLAPEKVKEHVDVERNLERGKGHELAELAGNIRTEPEFDITLKGRSFKVSVESVPELEFFVAALE